MRHLAPGVYYGWLIVATTFWMAIFTGGGRTGFGVFVLPMSEELRWSRGTISLAAALGALISGVSQPFVGRLYDRRGGRRLILVCLLLSGLGTARIVKKPKRIIFAAFTVLPLPAPHLAIRHPIAHTHSHEETADASGGMIYGLEATTGIYHWHCR
jgi:MFS family permease